MKGCDFLLDFIVKYWVQELFGIIIIAGSFIGKKLWKRYKAGKDLEEQTKLNEHDDKVLSKIGDMCDAVTSRIDKLE